MYRSSMSPVLVKTKDTAGEGERPKANKDNRK